MDHVTFAEVSVLPKVKLEDPADGISLLTRKKHIRIGAYTVDAQTNVIRWRGEMIPLSGEQRQTLRILLQHAGQILSCERLGHLLHVAAEKVDSHVYSLRTALEVAGVSWVPRRVDGCGYILWR